MKSKFIVSYSFFVVAEVAQKLRFLNKYGELETIEKVDLQYTRYTSTDRGSSLAVNDLTMEVRVTSDRPSTP